MQALLAEMKPHAQKDPIQFFFLIVNIGSLLSSSDEDYTVKKSSCLTPYTPDIRVNIHGRRMAFDDSRRVFLLFLFLKMTEP